MNSDLSKLTTTLIMTVLAHRVGLPERGYNAHHFTTTLSVAGLRRSNQRLLVEAQRKEYILRRSLYVWETW